MVGVHDGEGVSPTVPLKSLLRFLEAYRRVGMMESVQPVSRHSLPTSGRMFLSRTLRKTVLNVLAHMGVLGKVSVAEE